MTRTRGLSWARVENADLLCAKALADLRVKNAKARVEAERALARELAAERALSDALAAVLEAVDTGYFDAKAIRAILLRHDAARQGAV